MNKYRSTISYSGVYYAKSLLNGNRLFAEILDVEMLGDVTSTKWELVE